MPIFTKRPRTVQNLNDPNYFLNTDANGDFNTTSGDQSGYGVLPAAEKNSSFIAYFDGIGATTPEIINQTGFFVKYLIDELGNVSEPTPDSIALYNLNNIFQGSTAIVESQDATRTLANLVGEHNVTDIGTIQPLLITETGSNPNNYITTMSFAQYGSIVLTGTQPPNYAFKVSKNTTGNVSVGETDIKIGLQSSNFGFNVDSLSNTQWNGDIGGGNGGVYTFSSNTGEFNVDVSFQFRIAARRRTDSLNVSSVRMRIELSTDGGSSWNRLPISNTSTTSGGVISSDEMRTTISSTTVTNYMGISSTPRQFNSGDRVRFIAYIFVSPVGSAANVKIFGLHEVVPTAIGASTETYIAATTNYSGELTTTSSYWAGATYPTDGTPQYLTASSGLTGFLNNNMVQLTPTASLNFNFSQIIFPANIQPGDNIRFEYDLSKTAKIYEIGSVDDGTGRTTLKISPAIPTGSKLDHFVIYRVVNDGNYVILDVKKEDLGTMTGFLKPKYISEALKNNLPTIINNLKRDNVI
jgi:hypothetical protein